MVSTTLDPKKRFRRILEPMQQRDQFTIDGIKSVCEGVSSRAVSSVIQKLTEEGWLIPIDGEVESLSVASLRWSMPPQSFNIDGWIESQLCGTQLTQTPLEERPRERLIKLGASELRTAELFAILIRTGRKGESALQAGERLANRFASTMHQLPFFGIAEMKQITSVISEPAFCQIMAGIELGRRVAEAIDKTNQKPVRLQSADVAIDYCRRLFARLASDARQEEFHIVTLDTKYQPIGHHRITVGTLDASLVHPREVFRPAIRDAASAVILLHNHPSGDPTPSNEDRQVTRQLEKAAEIIGITVLDHIIVAGDTALSLKQWESR